MNGILIFNSGLGRQNRRQGELRKKMKPVRFDVRLKRNDDPTGTFLAVTALFP
jgi:hypothetical protein